ncbi:MarR family transcriptional regulator [Zhihengliuella sp.]|uniref:MarR family winged helix-turn-helix transcriptional regulator n=1 Tax=Zhihengliuella sp. TaxID=1954483 RepID=UPI002811AE7A|nr:MarR family transcriptional regulator [Zhihengliuella sp.]
MDAEDPLSLERQVCFALAVASRSVIAAYRPVLEPLNLTHPQYLVMLALWEREPLSLRDVGALLHLDAGTVSPLVKRLESLGYVERQRDPDDERSLRISLTPEGRALRAQAERIPAQMMARLDMDAEELAALHASMTKLISAATRRP